MAASANPPAGNNSGQEGTSNGNGATSNGLSVPENSVVGPTQAALRHNPGLSVDWTPDEQSLLEELLAKYATESNISRYAKIAMQLKDKTVRDVALRCRWMSVDFDSMLLGCIREPDLGNFLVNTYMEQCLEFEKTRVACNLFNLMPEYNNVCGYRTVSFLGETLYSYGHPLEVLFADNYECFLTVLSFRSYGCQLVFHEQQCCEKQVLRCLTQ
ncbi:F21O3.28 protein isoform 3 [Capsicum annuum]|nr:F21O3.28 protein isoform 3 [Capsicum annuum]